MIVVILLVFGLVVIVYVRRVRYEFEGVKKFSKKAEVGIEKERKGEPQSKIIPAEIQQIVY